KVFRHKGVLFSARGSFDAGPKVKRPSMEPKGAVRRKPFGIGRGSSSQRCPLVQALKRTRSLQWALVSLRRRKRSSASERREALAKIDQVHGVTRRIWRVRVVCVWAHVCE